MSENESAQICILSTGGTIASTYDEEIGAYRPSVSIEALLETLPPKMGNIEVVTRELFQLDSANAQPHHWQEIASSIQKIHEEIPTLDGIVILHGTDTMAYSSSAISFMVQDFGKPIVFTGSQIPTELPWSDGPRNLRDAIRVAAWGDLGEACIVFNGEIHRGTRARKLRAAAHDAFDSVDPTPLGYLSREIVLYENRRKRHNLVPTFDMKLDDRVFLLKTFPGLLPQTINKIVELGYHGIVIEGYGSGNIPSKENALAGAIKEAVGSGCTIVVSTQCAFGKADLSLYAVGKSALEVGALSAFDMTSEAALVKLMWVFGHTSDSEEIEDMMATNYVGEVTATDSDT